MKPPFFEGDESATQAARLLHNSLLALLLLTFGVGVIVTVWSPPWAGSPGVYLAYLAGWTVGIVLVRRRMFRLVAVAIPTVLWLVTTYIILTSGGIQSPFVVGYITLI
ncbi:MAG: hypothetical protein FJZ96_09960 [Chloroflexi bacterium]|nr:hypothetical protein [Chloroflexota bacterium]